MEAGDGEERGLALPGAVQPRSGAGAAGHTLNARRPHALVAAKRGGGPCGRSAWGLSSGLPGPGADAARMHGRPGAKAEPTCLLRCDSQRKVLDDLLPSLARLSTSSSAQDPARQYPGEQGSASQLHCTQALQAGSGGAQRLRA